MILWCDGAHDPLENMRRDALLLARAGGEGDVAPVLRLFRFQPHGITLGYAQRAEHELDLDRCRADQIPWAVRPTGGRAIFHAEEWTYSLAARLDDPDWGGTLTQAYGAIADLLVRALIRLGVPARHSAPSDRRAPGDAAAHRPVVAHRGEAESAGAVTATARSVAAPCFASTARHEVVLEGRKLIGSAQRRTARALLQQGSLLLGNGHLRLTDYLAIPEGARAAARAALDARSHGAHAFFGSDPPLEDWGDALMRELPGARRLDGAAGLFLLTPPEPGSYTAAPR